MNRLVAAVEKRLRDAGLVFHEKPIVIGGMAMEYYGIRKSAANIDLVVSREDYDSLAARYPENRVDFSGDRCVVVGELKLWRSIALMGYGFYAHEAGDLGQLRMVSLDRLLFMRVCAMGVEKYMEDLRLIREHYFREYADPGFREQAREHEEAYRRAGGVIYGGDYGKDGERPGPETPGG